MRNNLYPLDNFDIKAVAKSRVNRTAPQNIKVFLYGGIVVACGGFAFGILTGMTNFAMVTIVIGGIGVYYSQILSSRIAKVLSNKYIQEAMDENDN